MFGIDWTTWLLLFGALFLVTLIVLMFLLPFSVFKIRNILIDMSEDLDEIARNIYFIAKEIEDKKKKDPKSPFANNP